MTDPTQLTPKQQPRSQTNATQKLLTSPLHKFLRQNCDNCICSKTCGNPSDQQLHCILAQMALSLQSIAHDTAETENTIKNIEENGVTTYEEKLT